MCVSVYLYKSALCVINVAGSYKSLEVFCLLFLCGITETDWEKTWNYI